MFASHVRETISDVELDGKIYIAIIGMGDSDDWVTTVGPFSISDVVFDTSASEKYSRFHINNHDIWGDEGCFHSENVVGHLFVPNGYELT